MPFIWRSFCVQWWILQPCIGKCSRTENFKRISTRFTVEDNNLSFGAHTLCKKCSWRIKKFEAAVKEIANLNWEFYNFFLSIGKEQVYVQNAVPGLLYQCREHCVVQHRVQKFIEIMISQIPLAKPPQSLKACYEFHPFAQCFKSCQHCRKF